MGGMSNYLADKILDQICRNTTYTQPATVYSALFTVVPSDSTAGTEVTNSSSGYTRVASTFATTGATTAAQTANSGAVTFATAAAAYTVVGWGLLDTSTVAAGNLLFWATVTTTAFAINDQATFAAGAITISNA